MCSAGVPSVFFPRLFFSPSLHACTASTGQSNSKGHFLSSCCWRRQLLVFVPGGWVFVGLHQQAYLFPELDISPATFKAFRKIPKRIFSVPEVAFCWKYKVTHFWEMMFVMLPCYLQHMAFFFPSEIAKCIIRFNWEFVSGPKIPKEQSFGVGLWCSLGSSSVSVPGDVYFIMLLLSFPLQTAVLLSRIRSKRRNCFLFSFSFPVKLLR